jgi:acetylglutamate kinase
LRITAKLGGSILEERETRQSILAQVAALRSEGHEIVLVHGGGKSLSRRLEQLGLASQFVDGLRVTDGEVIRVALMVLAGEVNKSIVGEMGQLGCRGLGICGVDAAAVRCVPLSELPGAPRGLGFVGKPVSLDRAFFDLVLGAGLTPAVSSIALGQDALIYNVNADQMASICASGTGSETLVYLTDVPGVFDESGEVCGRLGRRDIMRLRAAGVVKGGMLPKTESCLDALDHGVPSVYIVSGRVPDALRSAVAGTLTEGTRIYDNS